MNSWSAVGAIFLVIGFILLIAGVGLGLNAVSAVNQLYGQFLGGYANQLMGTLFWSAAGSYIIGSLVCFAIGGVGLYAGGTSHSHVESPAPSRLPSTVPSVSHIQCGSCGALNDVDAVFCKKCGNQLR